MKVIEKLIIYGFSIALLFILFIPFVFSQSKKLDTLKLKQITWERRINIYNDRYGSMTHFYDWLLSQKTVEREVIDKGLTKEGIPYIKVILLGSDYDGYEKRVELWYGNKLVEKTIDWFGYIYL